MKNLKDPIGNQIRELPARSAVSYPTALQRELPATAALNESEDGMSSSSSSSSSLSPNRKKKELPPFLSSGVKVREKHDFSTFTLKTVIKTSFVRTTNEVAVSECTAPDRHVLTISVL